MLAIYKEASLSMIMIISAIFIMSLGFIVWYGMELLDNAAKWVGG